MGKWEKMKDITCIKADISFFFFFDFREVCLLRL
jgi:hypothetical protein